MKKVLPALPLAFSTIAILTAAPAANASVIFQEDFQTQTVGAPPTGATVTGPAGKIVIVDGNSAVTDPFGPEGNQSLMLEKTSGVGAATPRVAWAIPDLEKGIISFDVYTYQDSAEGFGTPLFNFFAYENTTATVGTRFWVNTAGTISIGDGSTTRLTDSIWNHNTVNHVSVEIFDDKTYSLTINGTLIGWEGGSSTKTRFAFQHSPVDGLVVNTFQFSIADSTRVGARFFVDNVQVIPEPGALTLLGGALIAGLVVARNRRMIAR